MAATKISGNTYWALLTMVLTTVCLLFAPTASYADAVPELGKSLYLDTEMNRFIQVSKTRLLEAVHGKRTPTGQEVSSLVSSYSNSSTFQDIVKFYTQGAHEALGIPDRKVQGSDAQEAWFEKHQDLYEGMRNYTGDEGGGNDDVSWVTINEKLRHHEAFSPAEESFYESILNSIKQLPYARGLVFRGVKMTGDQFAKLSAGNVWQDPAFASTSLSAQTAESFSYNSDKNPKYIMIIDASQGCPIGALGDRQETEILLLPNTKLKITYKVFDAKKNIGYLFAVQE